MPAFFFTSSSTLTLPSDYQAGSCQVFAAGPGGSGGTSASGSHSGGSGGTGSLGGETNLGGVAAGSVLTITIGAPGSATTVTGGSVTVTGNSGGNAAGQTGGTAGAAPSNTVSQAGTAGTAGTTGSSEGGAGSPGAPGLTVALAGAAGTAGGAGGIGGGGTAGTGGGAAPYQGANGVTGGANSAAGNNGNTPAGAGSGGGCNGGHAGGSGQSGWALIIYAIVPNSAAGVVSGTAVVSASKKVSGSARGIVSAYGAAPRIQVVNQWAGTFAQPAAFGITPPALQSTVIALTGATSVGGGSGVPSAGNWLVCICGWNQKGLPAATVGDADDVHSFWRCMPLTGAVSGASPLLDESGADIADEGGGGITDETGGPAGAFVSPASGKTRTSIWYTANLIRAAGDVYAAPSGAMAGRTCLVIEIAGLGPWDVVTGAAVAYAAAATSLGLSLPAPPAASFVLAAATGDLTGVSQALAPSGWTTLATVTASDGSDHVCDAVLTSAYLPSATGPVSVSATAGSATDLSGVIIAFQVNAPSPVPGGANPAWAGRMIAEAAFGAGYQTPPDQCTWTTLLDSEWPSPWSGSSAEFKRLWSWRDSGGIPWGLGQYQSSSGTMTLDNADGWLSPSNVGSGFYSTAVNANMSFQSGVAPWTAQNGATLARSAAQVFATASQGLPQYSLLLTPDGTSATPGAVSERAAVSASSPYSVSAWLYNAAGYSAGAQVAISWYTSGGSFISAVTSTAAAIPAATWTQFTLLNQASPSNAAFAAVTVQLAGTPPAVPFWAAEAAFVSGAAVVQTGRVNAGTPVRVRVALGTIAGQTIDRWYCWARNAQSWPETRNKYLRNLTAATLTDPWQSASGACPTPYRGEVEQDLAAYGPGWWWPCDDQALAGGVLPVSLRNAARGSSTVLSVVASPSGVSSQDAYSSGLGGAGGGGTDLTAATVSANPAVATYAVAQSQGWMYGDPQASPQSAQTGNPVTAQPGSAAWEQSGLLGNTGSAGWVLTANDAFPALSTGLTVSGWWNCKFLGTAASSGPIVGTYYNVAGQPYSVMTLWELATGSAPVAILQLDISGHLNLLTFNGGTSTSHSIYTASDLRCAAWIRVTVKLTSTSYAVYLNGSLSASASGSCTISAAAPTWFIAGGDLGSNGGSAAATGLQHGGNMQVSHLQIYSGLLPLYRELAHYSAAVTGFGLLPAPTSVQVVPGGTSGATAFSPDGTEYQGSYGNGTASIPYTMSALAVAVAGSYTSGPAARTAVAGRGGSGSIANGAAAWVGWTALAPLVQVYTSASADTETEASSVLGSGDCYTSGYGASASGHGTGHVSGGTGASPPSAASALGDTVAQRLERILGYGSMTTPMRAVDAASALVQAAADVGGQQTGANCQAVIGSDNGWAFYDNVCVFNYRSRPHMNSDGVIWNIGMNTIAGQSPFGIDITADNDPQRVFTAPAVTPYSPSGASLAELVPANFTAANAAQAQYGPRPLPVTSYLQSSAEQQAQVNWLLAYYGTLRKRLKNLTVDAATHPAAWPLIAGINISDLISVTDMPLGAPATTTIYRVSFLDRQLSYSPSDTKASVTITGDPVLTFWT